MIQDNEVVNICLDKLKTMNLLNEYIKENVTKTYTFENFEENNQTFIIKLRNSYGSKFLKCFKHREEIDDLMLEKDKYIIQEYLSDESEEYTIGVFSDGNIVRSIIFKRKLEHGYTSFVELIENQKLHDLAIKVCSILNIRGSINIQLRKDNDNYKIFEINPRLSGTVYFRHILGFDDVLWWLALLDKNNIPEYKNTYKRAIGVRELNEKFLVLQD